MIYKVLKPKLFIPETKLLGKYKLWGNRALNPTQKRYVGLRTLQILKTSKEARCLKKLLKN